MENIKTVVRANTSKRGTPVAPSGAFFNEKENTGKALNKGWSQDTFLAVVSRVNSDSGSMDVLVQGSTQILTDIPLVAQYVGPGGFSGVCPEIGALVVLMNSPVGPVPVTYLVPQPEFALECQLLSMYPESVSDPILETNRLQQSKYRRIRPGEARYASAQGSEIFLDEDVEITDSMDNGIRIRSGDGSVIATSQQNYLFANGVWRSAGPIQRNSLDFKSFGEEDPTYEAEEVVHSDGFHSVYIGGKYQYNGRVYNEYLVEVEDTNVLDKVVNDVNEGVTVTPRKPKVAFILGNMVGNDSEDPKTYGKFLAPAFMKSDRGGGALNFDALNPSGGEDILGKRGVAWGFNSPGRSFLGQDKEGVLHAFLGESRGSAPGVSQYLVARGGRREEWGIIRDGGLSWDLLCRGGINWTIGSTTDNPVKSMVSRSSQVRYLAGTYTEYGFDSSYDPNAMDDLDGEPMKAYQLVDYKRVERVSGKSREEIKGDVELVTGGSQITEIGASKSVSVGGSYEDSTVGDRTISTAGAFSINAINEIKVLSAQRTEKFVKGSDKKTILLGDDSTDILKGSQTLKIAVGSATRVVGVGNIEDTIATGDHKTTVAAGNYSVNVLAGNMTMKTLVGQVTLGGTTVSVEGLVSVSLMAPLVGLGNTATRSGVITFLSHKDYVTGAPLIPSLTVTAGM